MKSFFYTWPDCVSRWKGREGAQHKHQRAPSLHLKADLPSASQFYTWQEKKTFSWRDRLGKPGLWFRRQLRDLQRAADCNLATEVHVNTVNVVFWWWMMALRGGKRLNHGRIHRGLVGRKLTPNKSWLNFHWCHPKLDLALTVICTVKKLLAMKHETTGTTGSFCIIEGAVSRNYPFNSRLLFNFLLLHQDH